MEISTIKVGVDNCYLIKNEGLILIDGGMPGASSDFFKGIQRINIDPTEIQAVVITHCHWDHIGCTKAIRDATGAKILVHKNEKHILEEGKRSMPPGVTRWGRIFGSFLENWSQKFSIEQCEVDIAIEDDGLSLEEFGLNAKIVFTPGHSSGSVSVVMDTGDAFVGDMAMNGLPLTIGASLPIFAEDTTVLSNSWRKLADVGVKQIYPAHGKPFAIEKLLKKLDAWKHF